MDKEFFQGRQIFKFGLLKRKDNKKNLKIRLVFNRLVGAFFPPYYSYTKRYHQSHYEAYYIFNHFSTSSILRKSSCS